MEKIVDNRIKVLDKGYVRLLNIAGAINRSDLSIESITSDGISYTDFSARDTDPATCARISFNNFNEVHTEEQDLRLVEYLMKNLHTTPFEMTTLWFEMKMPIFVARQSERHRTAKIFEGIEEYSDPSINEVSGRYTTLPADWYIPEIVGGKSTTGAKQGQEDNLPRHIRDWFQVALIADCEQSYENYLKALNYKVAPEHARLFLHVNHYTHWVWKQDLHNLMHFLSLRLHSHAQVEARAYAEAIYKLIKEHLPKTMELFDKYRRI